MALTAVGANVIAGNRNESVITLPVTDSTTLTIGDFVELSSGKLIKSVTALSTSLVGVVASTITSGVYATTGHQDYIGVVTEGLVKLRGLVENTGAGTYVTAIAVGTKVSMHYDSTTGYGQFVVNSTAAPIGTVVSGSVASQGASNDGWDYVLVQLDFEASGGSGDIPSTIQKKLTFTGTSGAIDITGIQTPGGWNDGAIFQYGVMNAPIACGTVSANDLVLKSICASATATAQWVIGEITQLETAAACTGYFLGGYNYLLVAHNCGAAIAQYVEIDISGTSALSGNHQGLFSEIIVAAGSVITGAGKIVGASIEMNVVATATVANPVIGLEVDMRDVKVDCAGEMIGIKVTKAGSGNYLDYGMQFSNQFQDCIAVLNFDLTQGNAAMGILFESGSKTTTTAIGMTGAHTNLFALPAEGTAPVSDTTNVVFGTDPVKISILIGTDQYYMLAAKDFS